MALPTLVVCGTLTLDTIERGGEVHRDIPGGSALYASAAASSLVPVRMLGTVGRDFPPAVLEGLGACGVDATGVERLEGPTFRWHARYDATGGQRVTVSRDRGVAEGRLPPLVAPPTGPHALLLGSTSPVVQAHVRAGYPQAMLVGLDSMAHWWHTHADAVYAVLAEVQVLFVDGEELRLATGSVDEASAVARLHAAGPDVVVVKRGAAGASLRRRGAPPLHLPAQTPAQVVDTTGAGDALAGALLAALARGASDDEALRTGIGRASQAIRQVGMTGLLS